MKTFRTPVNLVLFAALIGASNHLVEPAAARSTGPFTPGDTAGFHLSVMHVFQGGADGTNGSSPLIRASDGDFYGVTDEGGTAGFGTFFTMTPAGITRVLHTFTGGADGGSPIGGVVEIPGADETGFAFGTTYSGGAFGNGTVFRVDEAEVLVVTVHHFAGGSDGAKPRAALILAPDGNLYGTTQFGGTSNRGTIFRMTLAGVVTVLHSFSGAADGAYPYGPLVRGTDGNFYGTVYAGDTGTFGRVFKMTPDGTVTVMHTFTGGADGGSPLAGLVQATDGNFYGATSLGGPANKGTLFRITPAGVLTTLKSFDDGAHGGSPDDELIQGSDGNLYGVAKTGASGYGVVFQMTLDGVFTVIHTFTGGGDGANPSSALLHTTAGMYGSTSFGGGVGKGVLYRVSNAPAAPFTDPTLAAGSSTIRAVHITELRTRIDAIRAKFGLTAYAYTDPTLTIGTTPVKAVHVTDLRTAVNQAFDAAALPKPTYTDTNLTGVLVKAAHINELRAAVIDLE